MHFRIICRVKFIPFEYELKYNISHSDKIRRAFEMVPSALPHLVSMSMLLKSASSDLMQYFMDFVELQLPKVDSRLLMEYRMTVASAMVVINIVTIVSEVVIYSIYNVRHNIMFLGISTSMK